MQRSSRPSRFLLSHSTNHSNLEDNAQPGHRARTPKCLPSPAVPLRGGQSRPGVVLRSGPQPPVEEATPRAAGVSSTSPARTGKQRSERFSLRPLPGAPRSGQVTSGRERKSGAETTPAAPGPQTILALGAWKATSFPLVHETSRAALEPPRQPAGPVRKPDALPALRVLLPSPELTEREAKSLMQWKTSNGVSCRYRLQPNVVLA